MRTYRATSRWHLDALLKTHGVELPCQELPKFREGRGRIGKQVQLPLGVEPNLDRAVVNAVVDPAPFELQLRGELRHGQAARDSPRMRLLTISEYSVTQPDDLHRARQDARISGRMMSLLAQMLSNLLVGLSLPGQLQDRFLHLSASRET